MTEHLKHDWKLHTHVDGCHFYQSTFICYGCGEVRTEAAERNFHNPDDPYAMVFAIEECVRCQDLVKGAMPRAIV